MDSLIKVLSKDVDVIYREDHIVTFNGFDTLHEALIDCNDLYKQLSFEDQMYICASMANEFAPLDEEVPEPSFGPPPKSTGRNFVYTYEFYHDRDDYACIVFDVRSGDIIFHEWFADLKEHDVMESLDDVEGLLMVLLKFGDVIEGDTLVFQDGINRDGDPPASNT
jgi:hypothetical protein